MNGETQVLLRRLKVALVCPTGDLGGAELWLLQLLDATDRLQIHAIVSAEGPLVAELSRRDIPARMVDVGVGKAATALYAARMRDELTRLEPDVVLANGVRAAAAAMPAAWWLGWPVVWVKHDHAFDGPLTRILSTLSTELLAPSAYVGESGTRRPPVVLPPALPAPALTAANARKMLHAKAEEAGAAIGPDSLLAVAVGRRVPMKGLDSGIQALALMADRSTRDESANPWHFLIIGEDDDRSPGEGARLMEVARRGGVADRVHLLGGVPQAGGLLSGADAVLQLTRPARHGPGREGFGMVVLEAASAGVPIVSTLCPASEALGEPAVIHVAPADP
ncbi:MAG: glycosyltransferase, partial [Ornithinimicrobium sp.]